MKLEIPIKVDLDGIDKLIEELKALQTYKLSEDDEMILVSLDDVAEVFVNHIAAKNNNAGSVKVTNCNYKETVYREDAIDALRKEVEMTHDDNDEQIYYIDADNAISVIEHLSSAQPDVPDTNVGDMIYRQDAIDEIDEWIEAFLENGHKESAADACLIQDGVSQLPSAQSERKMQCNFCNMSICTLEGRACSRKVEKND